MSARERRTTFIDRRTGDVTVTTELLPDAGFGQRMAELKTSATGGLPAGEPVLAVFAHLACDGCGLVAGLDYDHPELPEGWIEREDGDFCPACRAGQS